MTKEKTAMAIMHERARKLGYKRTKKGWRLDKFAKCGIKVSVFIPTGQAAEFHKNFKRSIFITMSKDLDAYLKKLNNWLIECEANR